jgi:4-hydroxyphenylpyruvate dioxygenase-like putative hemolysin
MPKLGKSKRAIAMAAAAVALAAGTALGAGGTANAAVSGPDPSTTDWFRLYLQNDSGGRTFLVCNEQSGPNTVGVQVIDSGWNNLKLQDVNTGATFYKANIYFNRGACKEYNVIGSDGSTILGLITTPNIYDTGWVTFN